MAVGNNSSFDPVKAQNKKDRNEAIIRCMKKNFTVKGTAQTIGVCEKTVYLVWKKYQKEQEKND
jgi:hypothetical protein